MGWSCERRAAWALDSISAACIAQTGSSNTFEVEGHRFFFETSRREHDDGAITGSIYRFLPDGRCKQTGGFRIEPGGIVSRGPKFFKSHPLYLAFVDGDEERFPLEPTEENLRKWIEKHEASFKPGGCNAKIAYQHKPPHFVTVVDLDGKVYATYEMQATCV